MADQANFLLISQPLKMTLPDPDLVRASRTRRLYPPSTCILASAKSSVGGEDLALTRLAHNNCLGPHQAPFQWRNARVSCRMMCLPWDEQSAHAGTALCPIRVHFPVLWSFETTYIFTDAGHPHSCRGHRRFLLGACCPDRRPHIPLGNFLRRCALGRLSPMDIHSNGKPVKISWSSRCKTNSASCSETGAIY